MISHQGVSTRLRRMRGSESRRDSDSPCNRLTLLWSCQVPGKQTDPVLLVSRWAVRSIPSLGKSCIPGILPRIESESISTAPVPPPDQIQATPYRQFRCLLQVRSTRTKWMYQIYQMYCTNGLGQTWKSGRLSRIGSIVILVTYLLPRSPLMIGANG